MVGRMPSKKSELSHTVDPPLESDFDLPVFRERQREHWPSTMTWADAMRHFESFEPYMRKFDSPEQRLKDKNPERFRLS